jgi:hypothetical protein
MVNRTFYLIIYIIKLTIILSEETKDFELYNFITQKNKTNERELISSFNSPLGGFARVTCSVPLSSNILNDIVS